MNKIIYGDCLKVPLEPVQCVFADPPDAIGLKYGAYKDNLKPAEYRGFFDAFLRRMVEVAPIVWISYNPKWTFMVGSIVDELVHNTDLEARACVQTFTFGQHRHSDLGTNHRPLIRLMRPGTPIYPDAIRVPSWRQQNGDKRADPRGRVPGDVFDFPRVTGNSKQRRAWHPTQLHEGLVERCIRLSTKPGDCVLDPFGGTGTTFRVCRKTGNPCTVIELDPNYCRKILLDSSVNCVTI